MSRRVPLADARGAVLAEELPAATPEYDRARVAGYAVAAVDVEDTRRATPVVMDVVADLAPHQDPPAETPLRTAVAVSVGAPLPPTTDAVVQTVDASRRNDDVALREPVVPGENVLSATTLGGRETVAAGTLLTARTIALLGAAGHETVPAVAEAGGVSG
ncbi:molybdenum cofactor biosynthesis protein MoeA [Halomicrobium sp. LC1Hm]|uniref:molybdenum cofactor biosynthesis protein MoeA n=1 Tax=Halomicrobium sp. LC1Hm TaxID=2610902 RepID=UPI001298507E|nr:molybdenum cofactor biosynthesis protein MoeA [Halomicrobium sp. LC1Hm]